MTTRDPRSWWDYKVASHMQRAWFDSFPPRSSTYLPSWGWETAPISFSPHLGFDRFRVDNCKSRQQKPAVQLSAALRAKAAHGSPITGFLFGNRHSLMLTCFWVCLTELSPRNHSRKVHDKGRDCPLQDTKAAQGCWVWPRKFLSMSCLQPEAPPHLSLP